jgi:hypothetical protein
MYCPRITCLFPNSGEAKNNIKTKRSSIFVAINRVAAVRTKINNSISYLNKIKRNGF